MTQALKAQQGADTPGSSTMIFTRMPEFVGCHAFMTAS